MPVTACCGSRTSTLGSEEWTATSGVRVVRTQEAGSRGNFLNINPLQSAIDHLRTVLQSMAPRRASSSSTLTTFAAGVSASLHVPGSNNYTDVLPTANVRFLLTKDLQLRFAAGKAIVRPSFTQMLPYTSRGILIPRHTRAISPRWRAPFPGTGGNPDLKPTRANQLDGSLEWYFAPTGSLTFDAFYKDIHDYIFAGPDNETLVSNGVTEVFQVTRYQNGSRGSIRGFEMSYQQFFDFLPGLLRGLGSPGKPDARR